MCVEREHSVVGHDIVGGKGSEVVVYGNELTKTLCVWKLDCPSKDSCFLLCVHVVMRRKCTRVKANSCLLPRTKDSFVAFSLLLRTRYKATDRSALMLATGKTKKSRYLLKMDHACTCDTFLYVENVQDTKEKFKAENITTIGNRNGLMAMAKKPSKK